MPQLLLEILSEEIPARMQARAEADLARALMDGLTAAGLIPEGLKTFSGSRRLAAVAEGLPVKAADVVEDIKGPKVGAPDAAIQGFLKKAGLTDISQAHIHDEGKKGQVYVAHVKRPGAETVDVVAKLVPAIVRGFHWPKSMRWGPNTLSESGELRWVRPIQRILCTFDGEIVPFSIDGIASGNVTEGHRVMGRGPYVVRRFEDYEHALKNKGHVLIDREERRELILTEAKTLCEAQNLELVEDQGLLEEVTGLAEWPVVLMGDMDPAFLDLPGEVIRLSMRTHQKYFAVRNPKTGGLAPKFIVVANLAAADGGRKIAAGNARVLSARLNDARFFWDNDRRVKLEDRFDRLGDIVFHEKLGTVKDKALRVMALAREIAPLVGADPELAARAAKLAKCDLVSDMVGEFPELEGVMGRYYATLQGEPQEVADAIRDHYRPKGPSDDLPGNPVAVAVALADKIDTLVGFWAIDEKPTGSKDPFALRRAALGVIRIILSGGRRLSLDRLNDAQGVRLAASGMGDEVKLTRVLASVVDCGVYGPATRKLVAGLTGGAAPQWLGLLANHDPSLSDSLREFLHDRLKVHLREQGTRHDLIDAVLEMPDNCDLVLVVKRVEALAAFLETDDGRNLLAGYRRAVNILKAEEKKDGEISGAVDPARLTQAEERQLSAAVDRASDEAAAALEQEDFAGAMLALSRLRAPADAFFEKVMVNADDAALRLNRLRLLAAMRAALGRVADFARIEG